MGYSLTLTSTIIFSFFLFSLYILAGTLHEINQITQTANELKEEKEAAIRNTQITLQQVAVEGGNVSFTFENTGSVTIDVNRLSFVIEGHVIEKDNLTFTLEDSWDNYWQEGDLLVVRAYLPQLAITSTSGETSWMVTPPVTSPGEVRLSSGPYIYCLAKNTSNPILTIYTKEGNIAGIVRSSLPPSPKDLCTQGDSLLVLNGTKVVRYNALGYVIDNSFISPLTNASYISYSQGYIFIGLENGTVYRFTSDGKNRTAIYTLSSSVELLDIDSQEQLHLFLRNGSYFWVYNLTFQGEVTGRMNLSSTLPSTPVGLSYFSPSEQLVVLAQGSQTPSLYYLHEGLFNTVNCTLVRNPSALVVSDGIYLADGDAQTIQKLKLGLQVKIITWEGWEGVWEL